MPYRMVFALQLVKTAAHSEHRHPCRHESRQEDAHRQSTQKASLASSEVQGRFQDHNTRVQDESGSAEVPVRATNS